MTIATTTTEHELLSEIAESERAVAKKEAIVNDLKEQMKLAKEEYEGAVYKLRELCRQQDNDANRPLLNGDDKPLSSGIDSVTLSSPGRSSVTLTQKNFGKLAKNAKAAVKSLKAKCGKK